MRVQLNELTHQISLFYLVICINIGALAFNYYGHAPDYLTVWFPCVIISLCFARSVLWFSRAKKPADAYTDDQVAFRLKVVVVLAFVLSIILTAWACWLSNYGGVYQQSHVAFFIAITLISAMFSTLQFPMASYMALLVGSGAFIMRFGFGDRSMIALTINFVPIMAVCIAMSLSYFKTLSDLMTSTGDLKKAHEELKGLYGEISYHRDHLRQEVEKQTSLLREQKLKLQMALAREKELNQLQNEFVSMVSHEFRTPLTVIDGTARRVKKKLDELEPDDVKNRMDKIQQSVGRMSDLVERTLDASRLASGRMMCEPSPVNLSAIVSEVVERQLEMAPDYAIDVVENGLPDKINADPKLCDHIFTNLIGNAVKYSGGSRRVEVSTWTENETVGVSVRDYGVGIPAEEMNRLTERFFRASTSVGIQGTGIGLHLVRSLVELHGGSIHFDSKVGEGTLVTVMLPIDGPVSQNPPNNDPVTLKHAV